LRRQASSCQQEMERCSEKMRSPGIDHMGSLTLSTYGLHMLPSGCRDPSMTGYRERKENQLLGAAAPEVINHVSWMGKWRDKRLQRDVLE
jgi:hypothetical protein